MSDADAKIKELQGLKGHVESTDSSIESLKFENKGIVATQSLFSQDLARLGPRLDDVATEMDSLSLEVHQSADDLSLLKKGTKRKFEDVNQLLSDLEGRLEGSDESLLKLEDKVQTLTLTVESLTQSNAKRSKKELATSAAVGAITGVLVVAGMVFAPEWS